MSDNKKYYYMRLKDTFFDSKEMKLIQSLPDGYLYSDIYLKLCLNALEGEGRLVIRDDIPYTAELISALTGHPVGVIKEALQTFNQLGMIQILETGVIYIDNMQALIGRTSTEAERKKAYRQRIANEEKGLLPASSVPALSAGNDDHGTNVPTNVANNGTFVHQRKETKAQSAKNRKNNNGNNKKFKAPTVEEVRQYASSIGYDLDAEHFIDYYTAKGWKVGNSQMKDWRATVRNWKRNNNNYERRINDEHSNGNGNNSFKVNGITEL